ncbi:cytochrome P450 [Trichoderma sp. SZMC 28015]
MIDELAEKGYLEVNKALGKPFVLNWWAQDTLFMPTKYLDDIRRADAGSLSFFESLSNAFHLKSSVGDLYHTTTMIEVVKRRLNPQLPTIVSYLVDECDFVLPAELGDAKEWKYYGAMELCSNIMHRVTSRVLVCKELCRKPAYIKASLDFSNSVFTNGVIMSTISLGPFRRLISWLGSFRHRRNLNKAMELLIPVIEQRLRDLEQSPNGPRPADGVQWTIEQASSDKKERTPARLAHQILQNLWAGSGAPGGMLTQMVYQVLWCPEYLEPMRAEIRTAVTEYGWTDKMLNNIPKVDSFLRETNRLHPNGVITAARTVMEKPYQFHDGLTLPVGARFAFPSRAIMCDSDNFENPYEFDGFRFARLSAAKEGAATGADTGAGEQLYNSATVTKTNLAFGYGKHACVGRFYAVRKIKLVFTRLIMEYEIEWDGTVTERPLDFCIEGQVAPNLEQKIRIKRRV